MNRIERKTLGRDRPAVGVPPLPDDPSLHRRRGGYRREDGFARLRSRELHPPSVERPQCEMGVAIHEARCDERGRQIVRWCARWHLAGQSGGRTDGLHRPVTPPEPIA